MSEQTPSTAYFIRRIIADQPVMYGLNALCWILFHTWPLIPGLLSRELFNLLVGNKPAGLNLATITALMVVAGLVRGGVVLAAGATGVPYRFRMRKRLQENLMTRILQQPGARAVPGSVGEAISTLRDDVDMAGEITDLSFDTVAALCYVVGGLAVLFAVNARITLLVFGPIAFVIGMTHFVRVRLVRAREQSREATARVTGAIGEIFGAVQAIQVAGAQERVVAYLRRLSDERQRAMLRDRLQALWLGAIFDHTADLGSGLVLLAAARQMRSGAFSVGDFALFASYLLQVTTFTSFLGYLINTYRQGKVTFRRMLDLLQGAPAAALLHHETMPSAADAPGDPLETLVVSGLTCIHAQSGRGVQDIGFTLQRGSFTVITGRVGSGKTTLLRALLGLLPPQAGEVRWNGRLVADPATFLVPPQAAYTAQVPGLLSGTVRENILLGMPEEQRRLELAVRSAVLERDLAELPSGLDTLVGPRGVKLSGGQVQRTAAARMYFREPELLLFDDLSSALDAETEQTLWQRALERQATCLVVSHRREALARADQILLLEHGRIADRGTLAELLQRSVEMRRLWASDLDQDELDQG